MAIPARALPDGPDRSRDTRRSWWRDPPAVAFFALCACIAAVPALLAYEHGVDVLRDDDWHFAELFAALREGRAGVADFLAPEGGRDLFLARAIWAPLVVATGLDLRWQMFANVAAAAALFGVLLRLAHLTIEPAGRRWLFLLGLVACALWFSPASVERWLRAASVLSTVALLAGCAAVLLLARLPAGRTTARVVAAAALCAVAALTQTGAWTLWPALIPLVAGGVATGRGRRRAGAIWLVTFASTMSALALLHGPGALPLLDGHALESLPGRLAAGLGAPWLDGAGAIALGTLLGSALVASLVAALLRGGETRRAVAPWLVLGGWVGLWALIDAMGARDTGPSPVATTALLPVALVLALAVFLSRHERLAPGAVSETALYFAAGALGGLALSAGGNSALEGQGDATEGRELSQCLRLIAVAPGTCLSRTGVDPARLHLLVDTLVGAGLLPAPVAPALDTGVVRRNGEVDATDDVQVVSRSSGAHVAIRGWAAPDGGRATASVVLLSIGPEPEFVDLAMVEQPSPDIALLFGERHFSNARWSARVAGSDLPEGRYELHAWAYDPGGRRLLELSGHQSIHVVP